MHYMSSELKKRSVISSIYLFFQTFYNAILGFVANLVLTVYVDPATFGLYITVLSILSLFNYFSDIGLVGALIQKKDIQNEDISTTFTFQQIIIIILVIIGFSLTNVIQNIYHFPNSGITLYHTVLICFFISSLKSIPSLLLERSLEFKKIVWVQMLEQTVFNIVLIFATLLHFNVYAFIYAIFMRSLIGLLAMYTLNFWKPIFGIHKKNLKELLSFGLPFQFSSFLALFKDDLIMLYVGSTLGLSAVGYIGWAKKWAETPLRIIMDNITKVLFPLLARLQDNTKEFNKTLISISLLQSVILIPILIFAIIGMPILIDTLPKYEKWRIALPLFNIFIFSSIIISIAAPYYNALNALKRSNITFIFMLVFTLLTWLLTIYLLPKFGLLGFAMGHLIVSMCYISILIYFYNKYKYAYDGKQLYVLLLSSLLACLTCYATYNYSFMIKIFGILVSLALYILIIPKLINVSWRKLYTNFVS